MNAQQHGSGAAERVAAYLDAFPDEIIRVWRDDEDNPIWLRRADLCEVLRELGDAKNAAELWEDTAMKLKNRIVGDSIHTERWHVIAAELRNLTARVEGYEATGSLRYDEDTEPDLSNVPLGEIDV